MMKKDFMFLRFAVKKLMIYKFQNSVNKLLFNFEAFSHVSYSYTLFGLMGNSTSIIIN
jgi:hypothetical protein